jgi:hypothetical protein
LDSFNIDIAAEGGKANSPGPDMKKPGTAGL